VEDILQSRRNRAAAAWGLDNEVVLVGAGSPIPIPGYGDQTYPFRAHSEYFWLADRERPGSLLALDPREGWTDFVPVLSEKERLWTGGQDADEGIPASELEGWLAARSGRPLAMLGTAVPGIEYDAQLTERLRETLTHVRRPKDDVELERMRRAVETTVRAFAEVVPTIRPGLTERALAIELEAELCRQGGQRPAYETIVGSGPNSAVLHFRPTGRVLREGELALIDAGAEVDGYACDVTRTYPVAGRFTAEQRAVYEVVLAAQRAAILRCRAGREFRDIHFETAVDLVRGLVEFGLLRGNPQSLVEQTAHLLFFPHGLGHLVGLGVRDASGRYPGRPQNELPHFENLRLDLPLERGYVITIEPGVYFIPALLNSRERRERFREQVDWDLADRMLGFGGIRIEDNVLVTEGEPENLTAAIPK
jgi:Xaa-Pro aminopeptidase